MYVCAVCCVDMSVFICTWVWVAASHYVMQAMKIHWQEKSNTVKEQSDLTSMKKPANPKLNEVTKTVPRLLERSQSTRSLAVLQLFGEPLLLYYPAAHCLATRLFSSGWWRTQCVLLHTQSGK